MSIGRSPLTAIVSCVAGLMLGSLFGCSSSDRPPFAEERVGLGCGSGVRRCDIHEAACRQDVLDAVACLRDYDEQVEQPTVHFIRLSDLAEAPPAAEEPEESELRLGYSLFGLVSEGEVEGTAARAAQLDNVAALYSAEDEAVYVLEDPGGRELTEAELGVSPQAYLMSLLAHEYVHFLQDRELDLEEYGNELPERFDPMLAGISAIEGEATLYEALFSYAVAGVSATEQRILGQFESYIDFSEEAIRQAESPALEARMLFPYTYGAYSNAVLLRDEGTEGPGVLREATSTLEFLQRRWSEVAPAIDSLEADDLKLEGEGFEKSGEEQFGPWVLNAFWSRTLGSSTPDALGIAQLWQSDRLSVWRNPDTGETIGNWAIQFRAQGPTVSTWASALADATPSTDTPWVVRVSGEHCLEITSSTHPRSEVISELTVLPSENSSIDAGTNDVEPAQLSDQLSAVDEDTGSIEAGSPIVAGDGPTQLLSKQLPRDVGMRLPEARTLTHRLRAQRRLQQFVRQRRSGLW